MRSTVLLKYLCDIPKRHILVCTCFFGVLCAFAVRSCISLAIVKMISTRNSVEILLNHTENTTHTRRDDRFDWPQHLQGAILSVFFIGNTITLLIGGYLAEKFGGKWTLSLGILLSGISSVLTSWLVEIGGANAIIVLRIIKGLGQGTIFPALGNLIGNWIPKEERSFIGSLVMGSGQFGIVIGNFISAFLLERFEGWSSVFYLFGSLSIVWFIVFSLICYDDPKSHPTISDAEKNFIQKSLGKLGRNENCSVPWKKLWSSKPFIAVLVAQVGRDWGFLILALHLPKYLNDVLKLSLETNGLISSLAFLVMWIVSLVAGYLADWLMNGNHMNLTNVRKLFGSLSSIGFGLFMLLASYAGLRQVTAICFILIAYGLQGSYFPSIRVNAIDLAPNYAGTLISITNGLGAITGFIGPYVAGLLTPHAALEEWRLVLWISFIIFAVSSIVYITWASAEQQSWNSPKENVKNVAAVHTVTTRL